MWEWVSGGLLCAVRVPRVFADKDSDVSSPQDRRFSWALNPSLLALSAYDTALSQNRVWLRNHLSGDPLEAFPFILLLVSASVCPSRHLPVSSARGNLCSMHPFTAVHLTCSNSPLSLGSQTHAYMHAYMSNMSYFQHRCPGHHPISYRIF